MHIDEDRLLDLMLSRADPAGAGTVTVTGADLWQDSWASTVDHVAERWPQLHPVAACQGLVVTTAQLRAAGVARHVVRRLVAQQVWTSPQPGFVSLARADDGEDAWDRARRRHATTTAAAVLANPGHLACGGSAAVLHGLPVLTVPEAPALTCADRRNARRGARAAGLVEADRARWLGVPVTSVARTCVDLSRHDRREGLVVTDAALHFGLVDAGGLSGAVARAAGWPGARQARAVIAFADARTESPLESLVRLALADAGFPAPEPQFRIVVPGRRQPLRVDFCWPAQRLVLEADGRGKYVADENWRQNKREGMLRRLGYRVERVTWYDLVSDWPATCEHLWAALAG